MAMLIHLCIIHGCFCATTAELSSCNGDHMAYKLKIFTLILQENPYGHAKKWGLSVQFSCSVVSDSLQPHES